MTPLHYACWEGHKDVVAYLIEEIKCAVGECVDQCDLVFNYKFFKVGKTEWLSTWLDRGYCVPCVHGYHLINYITDNSYVSQCEYVNNVHVHAYYV